MRTGWTDTDFKNIEDTDSHQWNPVSGNLKAWKYP
jgi:hypothetical protein